MQAPEFDPNTIAVGFVSGMDEAFELIEWAKTVPDQLIGLDVETGGLSWFDDRLRLVQFGTLTGGWAVPFDTNKALVHEVLRILTARGKFFVGHNFKFDLHFLERNTGWLPSEWRFVHDTMLLVSVLNSSGSKALKDNAEHYVWAGAKIGQQKLKDIMKENGWGWDDVPVNLPEYWIYGVLDTVLTVHLFWRLMVKAEQAGVLAAYEIERAATPPLFAMERNGLLVDTEHVIREQNGLYARMDEIEKIVHEAYGIDNINSSPQLALAFLDAGIELTEKTEKTQQWKMDKETFELIAATNDHPLLHLITEYRSSTRMANTYYGNFLKFKRSDDRCHPFYWPTEAKTGRMSATEPAILTVPRPDEDKSIAVRQVRNSFVPREGYVLISSDLSNVEARVFAHFADEKGMKQAFIDGVNLHKFTASQIFGKPIESIDKGHSEYTVAKNTLFCTLFGGGALKIATTAGITLEEGEAAKAGLYRAFPGMKAFQRRSIQMGEDNLRLHGQAFVRGIDGRILSMKETDDRYYAFTNWQIQSAANVVLKQRLAVFDNMGLSEYLSAAIHDEVVAEIPEEFEHEYAALAREAMEDHVQFSVPITANVGIGAVRWGDAK